MITADALRAVFESMGIEVIDLTPHPYDDACAKLSEMTEDEVCGLWDRYTGSNCVDGFSGEEIHFYLNKIGRGDYCAV